MSWSHCGTDSTGRAIGYAHRACCDQPGCDAVIDRGLDYACGGMHGTTELGCEKYFCSEHRGNTVEDCGGFECVCEACATTLLESGDWVMNTDDGVIERQKEEPHQEDLP